MRKIREKESKEISVQFWFDDISVIPSSSKMQFARYRHFKFISIRQIFPSVLLSHLLKQIALVSEENFRRKQFHIIDHSGMAWEARVTELAGSEPKTMFEKIRIRNSNEKPILKG